MLSGILGTYDRLKDYVVLTLLITAITAGVLWRLTVGDLNTEKEGRASDRKSYELAQSKSEAEHLRLKQSREKEDAKRKEEADAEYLALDSKYDAILVRYAAAQRKASVTYLPGATATPKGSDGPSQDTVLPEKLIIPYSDAEICAENTARLEAVQKWATQ